MLIALTLLHVGVCLFLILFVLLQTGKGADLASAFGMTGSQTAFGPRGATSALSKMTTWAAAIFMITSLTLYILMSRRAGSVVRDEAAPAPVSAPAEAPPAEAAPAAPSSGDAIIEQEESAPGP